MERDRMRSAGRLAVGLLIPALLLALPSALDAKTYTHRVRHAHTVGGCQGLLKVSETEVRYEADQRDHTRIWTYADIRSVTRDDLRTLSVRTYETQTAQLGRERPFTFEFMDGEISTEFFAFLDARVGRTSPPPTPVAPPGGRWEIAAKHSHLFGGCEGTIKITPTHIEYVTDNSGDARVWRYIDIKRLDSPSAYRLTLYTYEDQPFQLWRDKVFRFELKEALEPQMHDYIRQQMHR